jgi:trk system potassium uptake protein TrkA
MRIVIAGAGTLGRRVATYTREQHEVLVIEQSRTRAKALEEELGVKVLVGDADELSVLLEAGVDRADVFVAATGHDEDNLVASLLAKNEYKVRKVIAAVRNPRNRWLFNRSWGVDVAIDSAEIVSKLIEEEATLADVVTLLDLREGEVTVSSMMINEDHWAAGKTMHQLGLPEGCVVAALLHDSEIVMPTPETVVSAGDQLLIIAGSGAEAGLIAIEEAEP